MSDDTEIQYAYRYYDFGGQFGPLTREQVLDKLHNDLSTIPLERRRIADDHWTHWVESAELLQDLLATEADAGLPPVEQGDSPQVTGLCKSSTPQQEAE